MIKLHSVGRVAVPPPRSDSIFLSNTFIQLEILKIDRTTLNKVIHETTSQAIEP